MSADVTADAASCWTLSAFILTLEAKEKYRGMFEIQKSGDKTSSGEIGLDIRTHASPKVGQGQVSGGVSVPCRHATPVATENLNAYQTFLSSAKAIPIQEAQRLHCVDAASSDAENLCKGCLDSPALATFTYSRCTSIRGNDVIASGMRHQQKFYNFFQKLNYRYQVVLIAGT